MKIRTEWKPKGTMEWRHCKEYTDLDTFIADVPAVAEFLQISGGWYLEWKLADGTAHRVISSHTLETVPRYECPACGIDGGYHSSDCPVLCGTVAL